MQNHKILTRKPFHSAKKLFEESNNKHKQYLLFVFILCGWAKKFNLADSRKIILAGIFIGRMVTKDRLVFLKCNENSQQNIERYLWISFQQSKIPRNIRMTSLIIKNLILDILLFLLNKKNKIWQLTKKV